MPVEPMVFSFCVVVHVKFISVSLTQTHRLKFLALDRLGMNWEKFVYTTDWLVGHVLIFMYVVMEICCRSVVKL